MVVPVPPSAPFAEGIQLVDATGRFYIGSSDVGDPDGRSRAVRVDRLTGARVELPEVLLASNDLRWVITVTGAFGSPVYRWTNVDTGESQTLSGWSPAVMAADGQSVLATGQGGVSVVPRKGTPRRAPTAGAFAVALSPNARWAVLCVPNVGAGCASYLRWDTILGNVEGISADVRRIAYAVADDGAVLQNEWLTGDPFLGGDMHGVRIGIDGSTTEFLPVNAPMTSAPAVSADASIFAYLDPSRRLTLIDTRTGSRTTSSTSVDTSWALAPTGAFALKVRPAPNYLPDRPPTITMAAVPGRPLAPKVRTGERVVVPVSGVGSVAADATSVVLNVTVTNPAGPGYATVWPCDRAKPAASNVNVGSAATTVANAVIAKVAGSGSLAGGVCVASSVAAELVIDVQGYFTGSSYTGVTPDRFLDTRDGETDLVPNVARGQRVVVAVSGVGSVPDDATAVALNVTLTNPSGPGYATVWPCDRPRPDASNVNVTASGATVANAVIAAVAGVGASAGSVCVWVSTASDVIVDVQGYFTGSAYVGIVPDRFVDTRDGDTDGIPNVGAGDVVEVPVAGVGPVPDDVRSVVVNVTSTNAGAAGYLTVWPCDQERPEASNLNMTGPGVTVANAAIATVATAGAGRGSICVYTSTDADVIVDVQGYFTGTEYTGLSPARTLDTRA